MSDEPPVNPPPPEAALATYIVREALAVAFVGVWLLLFAGELLTGAYILPFWFHAVSIGVLAYALGIGVGQLTAYRAPSPAGAVGRVLRAGLRGEPPGPGAFEGSGGEPQDARRAQDQGQAGGGRKGP